MGGKAEYRSAKRSRRLIREAFLAILNETGSSKMTVTDLVRRADINRATFYAHYPDVQGVLDEMENEIIDKMLDFLSQTRYSDFLADPMPLLRTVSGYIQENMDCYRVLIAADEAQQFMEKLKHAFISYLLHYPNVPEAVRSSPAYALRSSFFAGGILSIYQQWLQGKLTCTLEDISAEISRIIVSYRRDVLET